MRFIRPAILTLIFFAALTLVAGRINRSDPFGEVPLLRDKWAYWQENKEEFDTVFIGTSRVIRGVMPSVFDRMTAEAGVPTRSYNFGLDGMFPPEDAYVTEHLLRDPPKKLRWVFIEMGVFLGDFDGRPAKSVRSIYWHDWPRTWLTFRNALWPKKRAVKWKRWFEQKEDGPSAMSIAMTHLEIFVIHSLNIGRGSTKWSRVALMRPIKQEDFGVQQDGFLPIPGDGIMRGEMLARYEKELAERRTTPARVVPLRPYSQESFDRMLGLAEKAGARVIFLGAPTTGEMSGHPSQEPEVPVFDYRDLKMYPELFEKDARTDTAHMSPKGAELFTRRIAEDFIKVAKSQPTTKR